MMSVSNEIQSLNGNRIDVKSTFNVALSNIVGSLHSLVTYLTVLTGYGFTSAVHSTPKLVSDTQTVLATNVQILIDTATRAISQSLLHTRRSIGLIEIGDIVLKDLLVSATKMSLLLKSLVKVHVYAIEKLLNGIDRAIRRVLGVFIALLTVVIVAFGNILGLLGSLIGALLLTTDMNRPTV